MALPILKERIEREREGGTARINQNPYREKNEGCEGEMEKIWGGLIFELGRDL